MRFQKKIIDIKLENNLIGIERELKLTSSDVENQLKELQYSGMKLKLNEEVENSRFPPVIAAFYYFIFMRLKIPSEKQLLDFYYKFSDIEIAGNQAFFLNKSYDKDGLNARILRTYPSIIRDFHFYLLLSESRKFDEVQYSLKADFCEGIDLKLIYHNRPYCISIYIATKRGKNYKLKKEKRHNYVNVSEIVIETDFESLKKVGDIYILTQNHIDDLIQRIDSK